MGKQKQSRTSPAPAQGPLYYKLHTLLETIRVIKTYEDPLCTLLHAIQTTANAIPEVERELKSLLEEMPAEAYAMELHGVRTQLAEGFAPSDHARKGDQAIASVKPKVPAKRAAVSRVVKRASNAGK